MRDLAAERQADPNQVALAWLLHQAFPVFPILGTKDPAHLRGALGADAVRLSPGEVEWLNGVPEEGR